MAQVKFQISKSANSLKWAKFDSVLSNLKGEGHQPVESAKWGCISSGVARAFPGGRVAHPKGQNEEENK